MERGAVRHAALRAVAEGTEVSFVADRDDAGSRLDQALTRRLGGVPGLSRRAVQSWIEEGRARVNGRAVGKPALRLAAGDAVAITVPGAPRAERAAVPEAMALSVLYEDEHLLALDKPAGLIVHPTPRRGSGTLWNGLLHLAQAWGPGDRPGLVSRLDRDTSGLLLVSKRPSIHGALARALKAPPARKEYLAVVYGPVPLAKGRIDRSIRRDPADPRRMTAAGDEGLPSSTLYERLAESPDGLALLRCTLLTGRTHQIRVHLAAQGWPIVGDPVYGERRDVDFPRQALHSWRLRLIHPVSREALVLEAPPPADLAGLMREFAGREFPPPAPADAWVGRYAPAR